MKRIILIFLCLVVLDYTYSQVPDSIWIQFEHISYDSIRETVYLKRIMPFFINLFDSLSNDNKLKSIIVSYNNVLNEPRCPDNYTIEDWNKEVKKAFVVRDLLTNYLFILDEKKRIKIINSINQ